jgi:hypothetical protein
MANPEHLQMLKEGIAKWNQWRAEARITPDLSLADIPSTNFRNANLLRTDFHGANLNAADFCGADIRSADLRAARLSGADLSDADLSNSNLRHANLRGANLFLTRFYGANLSVANLSFAYLHGTILSSSDLSAAQFGQATFLETIITDCDLGTATGLECASHLGPSTVGIDTLFKSKGRIPKCFLRGCGVPEDFVRDLSPYFGRPIAFNSCFISYSHEDNAFARLLHDRLQEQGVRCWLDEHQLLPGDDLHEGIDRGIRLWDKVLLCASKASLTSWWVDGEINRAFQKEAQIMKERGKKVLALIPLNLDGFLFSADYQSGKKAEITSRVAANFVGWEKDPALCDRELGKVLRALRTDERSREMPPVSKL